MNAKTAFSLQCQRGAVQPRTHSAKAQSDGGPANLQEMKAMVCFQGPESCQCLVLAHLKGKHSSDLWQRV